MAKVRQLEKQWITRN